MLNNLSSTKRLWNAIKIVYHYKNTPLKNYIRSGNQDYVRYNRAILFISNYPNTEKVLRLLKII